VNSQPRTDDSLKRLVSAATTGPQWGQSFSYDGFGNILSTVVTKGAAPSFYLYPDPATNRLGSSYQWDANGNLTARTGVPTLTRRWRSTAGGRNSRPFRARTECPAQAARPPRLPAGGRLPPL